MFGKSIFPFFRAHCLEKNVFSAIFHNHMYLEHNFPMELEYDIYYLSPDAFSYI